MGRSQAWLCSIEVDFAIDQNFFWDTVTGERISVPDYEVGIFAYIDRTYSIFDAYDPGGVQSDHLQSFFFGGAAVADGLGGFLIEAAVVVSRIALDGDVDAFTHGHHGVPGDGVPGLLLIAPPVGEGGDADIVGGKLIGNFVGFEGVMEGAEFVAELFGHCYLGQHLVGAVAVNLHQELPAQDVGEGLEFEIVLGRGGIFGVSIFIFIFISISVFIFIVTVALELLVVSVPLLHVVLRLNEGLALDSEIAHAGGG